MEGITVKLYYCSVVDNNDPDKKGRIKIRNNSLYGETNDSLLPWAVPFNIGGGGSKDFCVSDIPEKDTMIWCGFYDEGDYKNPYYVGDIQLEDFNGAKLFEDKIKSTVGSSSSYPDTKFRYFKNGICIGVDSSDSNPEVFISHPKTQIIVKSDGSVTIDSMGSITIQTLQDLILKTLDSGLWQPNILPNCLFTGAPHGGAGGGILKLKGI